MNRTIQSVQQALSDAREALSMVSSLPAEGLTIGEASIIDSHVQRHYRALDRSSVELHQLGTVLEMQGR